MPQMPAYQSRYGDVITELLARRGDIAAQGAMRSGEIWGSTVAGLGNLAANTYADYSQQKNEKKAQEAKAQAFTAALDGWTANDAKTNFGAMVKLYGPDGAKVFAGVNEALGGKPPTPEGLKMKVGGMRALIDAHGKDWFLANFDALAPSLAKEANAFFNVDILNPDLPEEARGEIIDSIYALDQQFNPKKGADGQVIETVGPDGKPVKRMVSADELKQGVPVYQKPDEAKAPTVTEFGGMKQQWNPETRSWTPLGASDAAINRGNAAAAKAAEAEKAAAEEKAEVSAWVSNLKQGQSIQGVPAKIKDAVNAAYVKETGQRPLATPAEAENAQGLEKMAGQLRNVDEAEEVILKRFDSGIMANPVGRQANKIAGAILEGDWDLPLPYGASIPIGKTAKKFSTDADITRLETQSAGLGNIARSQGEKGALSNQDVERVSSTIGKLGETREQIDVKRKERWDILNRGRAALGRLPKITTEAEYNKLSRFEAYIAPDGTPKQKGVGDAPR